MSLRKTKTEALPTSNELFDRRSKANQVVEYVNKVIQYKKQQEMILSHFSRHNDRRDCYLAHLHLF